MRTNDRPTGARRRIATVIALALSLALTATAAGAAPRAFRDPDPRGIRTPDDAHYTLSLSSDQLGFVWTGSERIAFTNVAAKPLTHIYLRLWDNAVSGCTKPLAIRVTHMTGGSAAHGRGRLHLAPRHAPRTAGPRPEDARFVRPGHHRPGHQLAVRPHRFDGAPRQRHPCAGDPRLAGLAPGAVHVERRIVLFAA